MLPVTTHAMAARLINEALCSPETGAIASLQDISGAGFKTIQAGEKTGRSCLPTMFWRPWKNILRLRPRNNPPYLECIRYLKEALPGTPLVGVFEPGFHVEIPEYAKVFGAPYEWYEKYGVQKIRVPRRHVSLRDRLCCQNPAVAQAIGADHSVPSGRKFIGVRVQKRALHRCFHDVHAQSGIVQTGRTGDIDPFVCRIS